jgi:hypothetical protein
MTRSMSATLAQGLWPLGALLELPRDMHCTHELPPSGDRAAAGLPECPDCRLVLGVMSALRSERPA